MPVPYTFGSATSSIPLSQLDNNFATAITLGNTAIQLGNTVTTLNNMTLANVTISSGSANITYGNANAVVYTNGSNVAVTSTALVFDGTNLGLGVTPSAWNASSKAFQWGANGTALLENFNGLTATLGFNTYRNSASNYVYTTTGNAASLFGLSYLGGFAWNIAPSGTAGNAITFTQAMTLNASGNLMVGTTSVSNANSVDSRVSIGNSSDTAMLYVKGKDSTKSSVVAVEGPGQWVAYMVANGNASSGWSGIPAGAFGLTIASPQPLVFATDSIERARIDSSGSLLVGITSNNASTPVAYFNATGGSSDGIWVANTNSAASTVVVWNKATTGNNAFQTFSTEGTVTSRGSITYNRAGGLVVYNTTSDYRAKDISGPVTDSGALIDSVPVYMGKMKWATEERPMFIAHETPSYAHTGEKDAVDADGNPVYQQMDASALIPVMWAEIQSLRKRLADAGI